MNNIIEKLGIRPITEKKTQINSFIMADIFQYNEVKKLERQRNEMLEALIEDLIEDELFYISKGYTVDQLVEYGEDGKSERDSFKRKQLVVETATGKSWSEIQELLV